MKTDYGSRGWLESRYAVVPDGDPWGLEWRPTQLLRYERMLESIKRHAPPGWRPTRILDLGCATGAFTARLGSLPGAEYDRITGIDMTQAAVDRARLRHSMLSFERMSIAEAADRFGGSADLVTCLEVIYYIDQPQRGSTVCQLRRMLKRGGLLLVSSMIGRPPYLDATSLKDLLAHEIEIVDSGTLHLKPFVLLEKAAMKLGIALASGAIDDRRSASGSILRGLGSLEQMTGRWLAPLSRSHAFVLGRNN